MKNFKFILTSSILFVALSTFAPMVQAQAVRTFVSSEGKDSKSCTSLINPCRNIDVAALQVQAGGEVVILDSGTYQPLMINKAISIVAAPGVHPAISVRSGAGISVNVGPDDVVIIRGLRIISQGGARGIHFPSEGTLLVEGCVISGFTPSDTDPWTDGILVDGPSILVVKDTIARGNRSGVRIFRSPAALIEHSNLENNNHGLWASQTARVTISDSIVAGDGNGIISFNNDPNAISGLAEINVDNCRVVGNTHGIVSSGKEGDSQNIWTLIRVSNTIVTSNNQGLWAGTPGSGRLFSRGNNTVEGNDSDGFFTDLFVAK